MKFYKNKKPDNALLPCVVLKHSPWDDYSYKTTHHFIYYDSNGDEKDIGLIKILENGSSTCRIPDKFDKLGDRFFSLGQEIEFYEWLLDLGFNEREEILIGLNDIVFNEDLRFIAQSLEGFEASLLRTSEARKILKEGPYLFGDSNDIKPNNVFEFGFKTKVQGAKGAHEVHFDFLRENIPFRINALIGKNGTGKTHLLANLANSLGGLASKNSRFTPDVPVFSRVIAISYSYFDNFRKPKSNRFYSYRYCGLRNKTGLMSLRQMERRFEESINQLKLDSRKIVEWKNILKSMIDVEVLEYLKDHSMFVTDLSSGQNMILTTITDVLANIKKESLLLFDEPELFLHPNAIANYTNMLYRILDTYNSYAVVSTHSPIIIQSVPSKRVHVLEREGEYPIVKKLGIESFGADLSQITEEIFGAFNVSSVYSECFKQLIKDGFSVSVK
ncbi:AAA family ATPase [Virgibacillus dakarensis]|nr:AAA family ATPase [Virgibacillus dakarensis]